MAFNALIAQGVRPIGADLPQIAGMLQEKRQADTRNALMQQQAAQQQQQSDNQNTLFNQGQEQKKLHESLAKAQWAAQPGVSKEQIARDIPEAVAFFEQQNGPGSWANASEAQVSASAQDAVHTLSAHLGQGPVAPTPMKLGKDEVVVVQNKDGSYSQKFANTTVAKPEETNDIREFNFAKKQGFNGTFFDYMTQMKRAGANSVSTTVNTERGLYGGMAGDRAKAYSAQFDAAQKAPESLAGAQRIRESLSGAALTGAGADWMLSGAKVAAQFGFNTGNAAADTEMLQRELASATLDAIASSGLGSGQGFTDNDRKFLQQAKSGQIQMQRETLLRVAALKEKAALSSIKQWNATAARLKPDQLRELGMSRIDMPTAPDQAPGSAPRLRQNQDGTYEYAP